NATAAWSNTAANNAIAAVGNSVLAIIWHLRSDPDARYHDLGPDYHQSRINQPTPDRSPRHPTPPTRLIYRGCAPMLPPAHSPTIFESGSVARRLCRFYFAKLIPWPKSTRNHISIFIRLTLETGPVQKLSCQHHAKRIAPLLISQLYYTTTST